MTSEEIKKLSEAQDILNGLVNELDLFYSELSEDGKESDLGNKIFNESTILNKALDILSEITD